ALSQSGETEEVLRLIPAIRRLGACLIAITERATSSLGQAADLCIALGPIEEACPLGLAPSASTTALMAVGDALALLVSRMRDFSPEDFALYHPGGSLGRKLTRVEDVMRTGRQLRRAHVEETVRAIFVRLAGPRRRSGAILIEDAGTHLLGIFTDSDLARLFEKRREAELDRQIGEIMTIDPKRVRVGAFLSAAVEFMKTHKISELPVVDRGNRLLGLIAVTDLIGLVPAEFWLERREVCFGGDDLVDLPVLRAVGLAAGPADAVVEVRDSVLLVTTAAGGRGAVREVVEVILKVQGLWHDLCSTFTVPAV